MAKIGIGILPVPLEYTTISVEGYAKAQFIDDKLACQAKVARKMNDSEFLIYVLALARKGGKYGRELKRK
jgi:hypothetical protein